ncbi:chlorophyll a/b-binding protein domain-containing protein [Pelagophyceae sp. CCMP2097]|nr:chlorophyll a/b-binding protein domain-containing protein [Pelagophyceae sp. CCMP2097]
MLAVVGFLVAESFHPLFADVGGPAIDHLTQVRGEYPAFFEFGALGVGGLEINRALKGWAFPDEREKVAALQEGYYPGDVGFDPLGLTPDDQAGFDEMVTKELQNGRLAMLAAAGFIAQELVNHKTIIETLKLLLLLNQSEIDQDLGIAAFKAGDIPSLLREIETPAADTFFK